MIGGRFRQTARARMSVRHSAANTTKPPTSHVGTFDLRYALTYHDYKLADVASKVTVPSQGR